MTVDLQILDRVAAARHFQPETLEIARRLLVFGDTPKRLSIEYGINHQRVYAIRKKVLAAVAELDVPDGWEEVRLVGPTEVIADLKARFAEALRALGHSHRDVDMQL